MMRLIAHLVVLSTFLYAGQPNDGLAVLQSLVENGVRVTLDLFLFPFCSFVIFLHLFPLYALQGLEAEREVRLDTTQIFELPFETVFVFLRLS